MKRNCLSIFCLVWLMFFPGQIWAQSCNIQQGVGNGEDSNTSTNSTGIWQPQPGTSWQWQLTGTLDTSLDVQMYDIDLFNTTQSQIAQLHNDGRIVICYFCAGSWEEWRPDASQFPPSILGNALEGWPDERWLDIRRLDVLGPILKARLDLAVQKGCDGVEPDNVDGYTNNTGFALTFQDQLNFNIWLANEAHARGLSVGLKNDLDQINELLPYYDWALNEQCFQYNECDSLLPFVNAGKAVFGVEYELATSQFCPKANAMNFDWLKKNYDLDAWRESCRDMVTSDCIPDIKANGSDGPVTITSGTRVPITITLDPGSYAWQNADWWIYVWTPSGYYSYVVAAGWKPGIIRTAAYPLTSLSDYNVFNARLPAGSYSFCFAVDGNADGLMDWTWGDYVQVYVQEAAP